VIRDGASSELLGLLTPEEGAELFTRLSGASESADRQAIGDIVSLCGNLPLAIRIAAYRSGEDHRQLASLAAHLADTGMVLDYLSTDDVQTGVRAAFSLSYRSLPAPCARLFRLLGLHAGAEFTLLAAAALAGADPTEADQGLTALADCHLLDVVSDGRYRLHDLLRVYAGECAKAEETPAELSCAVTRMSAWYLHSASAAAHVLGTGRRHTVLAAPPAGVTLPVFAGYQEALAFLDGECANAVATAAVAERYGLDADTCHYPNVLYDVFHLRARFDEWAEALDIALRASKRLGDKATHGALLSSLATVLGRRGRYDEALEHLDAALGLRRELGDRRGEAAVLGNIAIVQSYLGRYPEALAAFGDVRAIQHAVGDRSGEAMTLSNTGWVFGMDGQQENAIDQISQARDIFAELGEWASHARTLSNLAEPYMRLGRHAEAADFSRQALDVSRQAGVRDVESYALKGLGDAAAAMGQVGQAREYWEQALAIADDLGDPVADELRSMLAGAD
jgi:tetratricopeptide (TPR) repeat protein